MTVITEELDESRIYEIADYGKPLPRVMNPRRAYRVLDGKAPLFGMPHPSTMKERERKQLFAQLHEDGVRCLINLTKESSDTSYSDRILLASFCPVTDQGPKGAIEKATLLSGVNSAVAALKNGEGVVIHCWGGTGRTGTAIGCILRKLGKGSGDEIVNWLGELNQRRERHWPESPVQAEVVRECQPDDTRMSRA